VLTHGSRRLRPRLIFDVSQKMLRSSEKAQYDIVARRTGEIMHYIWDPIGVVHYPQARDEYDSYVPKVVEMLMTGKDASEIASHLTEIETQRMGLSDTKRARAKALSAAKLLLEHYAWLSPKG
jgi:hypothetical protein